MDSMLREKILKYIAGLHLKPGDRLPSVERIRRKTGATDYRVYQRMRELAAEKKWETVHGSGFYLPGRTKIWKPFESTVALISPGLLLPLELVCEIHSELMRKNLNLLPLNIPHGEPGYEAETLEFLLSRRIRGLIIEPNPDDPEYVRLIRRMQARGCRCILLSKDPERKNRFHDFTLNYRAVGRMAVEYAEENGIGKICFLNHSPKTWHMRGVREGLAEEAGKKGIAVREVEVIYQKNPFGTESGWENHPELPVGKELLYVVENSSWKASDLLHYLKSRGVRTPRIFTFTRLEEEVDPNLPCCLFDDRERFRKITEKLLSSGVWTKTGVETLFEPRLIPPAEFHRGKSKK